MEQESHQLVEQAKRHVTKMRPEAVEGGIFNCFFKLP